MVGQKNTLCHENHAVDVCVVGGGMTGVAAALAAARHGAKVVLIHDRPVLGGNASSEMRMHICGADCHGHYPNMRETGILEELRLENLRRNPNKNYSIWDTILYEKVHFEPNITLLLNCSCLDAATSGDDRIASVTGWQLTTQIYHEVFAALYVDCSGDGILAPLTGALCRRGREARGEYGESIAPVEADNKTMGMTCLFGAREYDRPQPFTPPSWAYRFERCEDLPYGTDGHQWWKMGYWWIELGGEADSIQDTERTRDELLKVVFGVWDHIKNHCKGGAENWALDWLQFLPAKRASRRYVGDHMLTQPDIEREGRFEDLVAYGGWSMDDHHPAGFWSVKIGEPSTIFHPAPCPYGIPLRSLYSQNIRNLMFAGRCASCTHAAMSSTRVMGTCMSMGQAAGTAAAMAVEQGIDPRAVVIQVPELQQALLRDDGYLPWVPQRFGALTTEATLTAPRGDPEPVRDGVNRPVGADSHAWSCALGEHIEYTFSEPRKVTLATVIVDSAMDKIIAMSHHQKDDQLSIIPDVMPRTFRFEGLIDGDWRTVAAVEDNHQRLVRVPIGRQMGGIRWVLGETWGAAESRLYAFYLE